MNRIANINNISKEYMSDADFQTKLKTVMIGDAVGSEKLYVNIDFVKPGGVSAKYHSHSKQEEFFLVMSGKGSLRVEGQEIQVCAGDVFSKPAGKDIMHQFINNGSDVLQILDIGTREEGDVITYPDESTIYVKDKKLAFKIDDAIKDWSSEPNE